MDKVDLEEIMGNYLKRWSQSPQSKFDNWLTKKLGNTKIDNVEEWCTLQILSSTYYIFYMATHIEIMDKEWNAKNILDTLDEIFSFSSKFPLARGGYSGRLVYRMYSITKQGGRRFKAISF